MVTAADSFSPQADEKDKDQQDQQGGAGAPPTVSGGQSAGITPGATPGANQGGSNPQQPSASGRYVNLQKYMKANEGFNGGQGLAGGIANNISQAGEQVKQNTAAASNAFQQQGQQQQNQWAGVFQPATPPAGAPAGTPPTQNLLQSAVANPTNVANNQAALNQIQASRDAQYTGPKSLADLQGNQNLSALQTQASGVSGLSKQAQNESGRFNLLRQMYGKEGYSAGQQNLDNLLLQGNKGQLQQLAATRQSTAQLGQNLNEAQKQAQAQAGALTQDAAATQQQVRSALSGAATQRDKAAADAATAAAAAQKQNISDFVSRFNSGKMTQADMARYGIQAGQATYGAQLSDADVTRPDINKYTNTSAADAANMAALNKMLGGTASPELAATLGGYDANATQIGKALGQPAYNADVQSAISAAQGRYNQDLSSALGNAGISDLFTDPQQFQNLYATIGKDQGNQQLAELHPEYANLYSQLAGRGFLGQSGYGQQGYDGSDDGRYETYGSWGSDKGNQLNALLNSIYGRKGGFSAV